MPPFTAAERQRIVERLRSSAAALFVTRGLRKSSLDDLVAPAGIAKSSFYSFYPSKEALFVDLMLEQLEEIRPRLLTTLQSAPSARDAIAAVLRAIVEILDTNPLYRRLVTHPAELEAVRDRLGTDALDRAQRDLLQPLMDFIVDEQRAGHLVDTDPATMMGVLQAVAVVHVNSSEFQPVTYPAVLELLVDTVAAGLTNP